MPTSPILESCENIPMSEDGKAFKKDKYEYEGEPFVNKPSMCHDCKYDMAMINLEHSGEKQQRARKSQYMWARILKYILLCMDLLIVNAVVAFLLYRNIVQPNGFGVNGSTELQHVPKTEAQTDKKLVLAIGMNLNVKTKVKNSIFQWTCPIDTYHGFVCDNGIVTIPKDGWYTLHLKVSIDTNMGDRQLPGPKIVYDCITKQASEWNHLEHIQCNRMQILPGWAGSSEITILRHYLRKGDIIKSTTKTDTELLHVYDKENTFEIFGVEQVYM